MVSINRLLMNEPNISARYISEKSYGIYNSVLVFFLLQSQKYRKDLISFFFSQRKIGIHFQFSRKKGSSHIIFMPVNRTKKKVCVSRNTLATGQRLHLPANGTKFLKNLEIFAVCLQQFNTRDKFPYDFSILDFSVGIHLWFGRKEEIFAVCHKHRAH